MEKVKNYTREKSAKDVFSLWENENTDLVRDLNEELKAVDECKEMLRKDGINI